MRYYGNGGSNFAWDLGAIFSGIPNLVMGGISKKYFLNFGLKGAVEKCVGYFLVYLFLKVLFFKKRYYGIENLNFCVKLIRRFAAIHITEVPMITGPRTNQITKHL